jgi:hypothetical protein
MFPAVSLHCYAAGRWSGEACGVAAQKVTLIRLSICHPELAEGINAKRCGPLAVLQSSALWLSPTLMGNSL